MIASKSPYRFDNRFIPTADRVYDKITVMRLTKELLDLDGSRVLYAVHPVRRRVAGRDIRDFGRKDEVLPRVVLLPVCPDVIHVIGDEDLTGIARVRPDPPHPGVDHSNKSAPRAQSSSRSGIVRRMSARSECSRRVA